MLGSVGAMLALIILLRFWRPRRIVENDLATASTAVLPALRREKSHHLVAYGFLVVFVLLWGITGVKNHLNALTSQIQWPGLHNQIMRMPPVVAQTLFLWGNVHTELALRGGHRLHVCRAMFHPGARRFTAQQRSQLWRRR